MKGIIITVVAALAIAIPGQALGLDRTGTSGSDTLVGTVAHDELRGLGGDDTLRGRAGADDLFGGHGHDYIVGGPGRDTIRGGRGSDTISAQDGEVDHVYCGLGRGDTAMIDVFDVVHGCEFVGGLLGPVSFSQLAGRHSNPAWRPFCQRVPPVNVWDYPRWNCWLEHFKTGRRVSV